MVMPFQGMPPMPMPPDPMMGMGGPMVPVDPMAAMMGGGMPGMGTPDPFGGMGGMDPLAMLLSDPSILAELLGPQALPRSRQKWQSPKKPTPAMMRTKAQADQTLLTALNRRFEDDLSRIRGESVGVFDDFDEDAEIPYRSSALPDEDQLIAALVGTMPPAFDAFRRHPSDEDEGQAKEDFLAFLHDEHRRQHDRSGFGDLQIEMVKTIIRYGRIITRNVCNFDALSGRAPFRMRLIDPATVYPTYMGERGLYCVTMVYRQLVGDLIGDHDDAESEIEAKVVGGKNDDGKDGQKYDYTDEVEVVEYWNPKWHGLFAADRLIRGPVEHDYGEPPFTYTLAPYGDPAYTRTPESRSRTEQNGLTLSSSQADLARRGLSHFHTRFTTQAQYEAAMGRVFTQLQKWGNEAIWFQKEPGLAPRDIPTWSNASGARNEVPDGIKLIAPPNPPVAPTLGPFMAAINEDKSRQGLPPSEYGLTPSQTSGYAIAGMSEHAQNKLRPVILTMQAHIAACGEQRLRFYRDWGHVLGDEGSRGSFFVPKSMGALAGDTDSAEWEVTPDMIDRTGTMVKVELISTPDVSTLSGLANATGMLKQQGAISRRDTIRLLKLPYSRNPEQAIAEIDLESIKEQPEMKLMEMRKYVIKYHPEALGFIDMLIEKSRAKEQASMAGPPPGPGGPPQGGGPANAPGLSLPAMGMPPGQQGGRPPEGGPPPMPMSGPGTEP